MIKIRYTLFFSILSFLIISCNDNPDDGYPMEKKYWTTEDYHAANNKLVAAKYNNKELPSLDNPKTAPIFNKLVDTSNISVVMTDPQLGITHRSKFASDMFSEYKTLNESYSLIDRTDKYQYPVEFAEIIKFGLFFQLYYIEAGNEKIIKDAEDPKAAEVTDIVTANKNVLIRNFNVYLDYLNYEDRFNDKAQAVYAEGLKEYFPKLISQYAPDGDYSGMTTKVQNMLKKAKNSLILTQLENIKALLESKTKK